jgi:hypothetical protein
MMLKSYGKNYNNMTKHWRRGRRHFKPLTRKEIFTWLLVSITFSIFFILYMSKGFLFNCVFEWPLRWDVKNCLSEQVDPASRKAAEKAVNFVP